MLLKPFWLAPGRVAVRCVQRTPLLRESLLRRAHSAQCDPSGLPRCPHAAAAASLIERALEGERAAPAISIDASQQPPVVRALEALLSGRRAFSEGLGDLLEILFAETPAFDLSRPIVKEQSQIDEMRAALRGDRERAEARRQAAGTLTELTPSSIRGEADAAASATSCGASSPTAAADRSQSSRWGSGPASACLSEGELERVQAPCELAPLLAAVERGKDGGASASRSDSCLPRPDAQAC